MPRLTTLSPEERAFFQLVARTAFSNPFSEERERLNRELAGTDRPMSRNELLGVMCDRVSARLKKLSTREPLRRTSFVQKDRDMLEAALLFEVYHRHVGDFDALIRKHLRQTSETCRAPFAIQAMARLTEWGFSNAEALQYFSIFFQVRRAFYFIEDALIGTSACMRTLRRHLWNNVFTSDHGWYARYMWNRMEDFSTLLLGETGTGKGTAAAAIGRSGYIPLDEKNLCFEHSFIEAFVSLNLSQFPASLIESELFGHRKGAFTGAVDHYDGAFSRCSPHGSIFLDEIGDVAAPIQIKLLQVIQDRTFSPVGGHQKLRFAGRVIGATNKPLDQLRRSGEFRDDFYYRLSSDVITVPPLRQRIAEDPTELDALLAHIVQRLVGEASPELTGEVEQQLARTVGRNYAWPGNVRELEQATRRILLTGNYEGDYPAVGPELQSRIVQGLTEGHLAAEELLAQYCTMLYQRYGTYEEVARRAEIDRRTAKKYITRSPSGIAVNP